MVSRALGFARKPRFTLVCQRVQPLQIGRDIELGILDASQCQRGSGQVDGLVVMRRIHQLREALQRPAMRVWSQHWCVR